MITCTTRAGAAAAIAIALAVTVPLASLASDGTISFTGAVTENSCTLRVNGEGTGDGSVALPVVDTTALGQASGRPTNAAGTFFSIEVSACALSRPDISGSAPTQASIYFEAGPNVDPATHALINTGTSNVEVTLYEASGSMLVGAQITPGTAGAGQPMSDTGTQYFYAAYSLPVDGEALPGTVSTLVTYSLVYR